MDHKQLHRTARLLIILGVLTPFIPILIWSFSFNWFFPDLLPSKFSLRAWESVLFGPMRVDRAMWNSFVVAAATTLISLLIGLPAGRALGLYHFRGKKWIQFIFLAPAIIPGLAVAMGIHVMFIRYRLTDTHLGVILVHLIPVLPYMVLILSSTFANYNVDFEDQARSLGANRWQVLWTIMLPTIFPGMMVAALFAFIISWSQYILTLLIGGGNVITLPILLFATKSGGNLANTAALSLIFIAPAAAFLIITSRYLTGQQFTIST